MQQTPKKLLIIGGGIGGLSAGCFAQLNGFDSTILEMHPQQAGGFVCGWDRKGYTIEGCIHHMAGLNEKDEMFKVYKTIGCFKNPAEELMFHDSLVRIEDPLMRFGKFDKVRSIEMFSDPDRLESSLFPMAESSKDMENLKKYISLVRECKKFNFFDCMHKMENKSLVSKMSYTTTHMKSLAKLMFGGATTLGKFANRFDSPFLRAAFPLVQYDFPDIPLFLNCSFVANLNSLGTIRGGGQKMAKNLQERYKELGGEIKLASKAEKIITKDIGKGKTLASGVVLSSGQKIDVDIVISCCDGYFTHNNLLNHGKKPWKFATPKAIRYYDPKNFPKEHEMGFHCALGVKRQLPDIPFLYTFFFPKGSEIEVNGKKLDHIMVENFTFDKSLAPEGKTVLKVAIRSGYHQWKELKSNSISDYNKKKQEVADRIIDALEMRFKGIRNDIEMIDTSTPVTVERYTNNFMGAQPWMTGETSGAIFKEQFMTIPKLYGFYHGGMWGRGSSGLNFSAATGLNVIRQICRDHGRPFYSKEKL